MKQFGGFRSVLCHFSYPERLYGASPPRVVMELGECLLARKICLRSLSGWWFGCHFLFSHIFGIIIPIDFHIFQRGGPTTNQLFVFNVLQCYDSVGCVCTVMFGRECIFLASWSLLQTRLTVWRMFFISSLTSKHIPYLYSGYISSDDSG